MSVYRVARRYAEAPYGLAEEQKLGERFAADLTVIQDAIRSSREFGAFLKSPVISKERKRSVLSELFKSKLSAFTFNFLNLLVEKGREELVGDIAGEFFRLRDDRQGLVTLDVRAAAEMDGDQQKMTAARTWRGPRRAPPPGETADPDSSGSGRGNRARRRGAPASA